MLKELFGSALLPIIMINVMMKTLTGSNSRLTEVLVENKTAALVVACSFQGEKKESNIVLSRACLASFL